MHRLRFFTHVLVVICLVAFGSWSCRRAPERLDLDTDRVLREISARADAAMEAPEMSRQLDALVDAIGADPRVHDSGDKLLGALGADPSMQPAFEAIFKQLGAQPIMKVLVTKLMREHPGMPPDQIGELVGKRVNDVTEGPAFDKAFNRAFDALAARPDMKRAFDRFGEKVADNDHVGRAIAEVIDARGGDPAWTKRLVALNGGKIPDRGRATDLILERVFTQQRLTAFYGELFSLPALRREAATAVNEVLLAPAFQRHASKAVAALVSDKDFQARAVDGMAIVLGETPSEDAIEAAVRRLIEVPATATAISGLLDDLLADRELGAIGDAAIGRFASDPSFRATIAKLLDGW